MKILMFAPIFPPQIGGPATQCYSLCKALLAREVKPVVLTPGERFSRTSPDGYPVYRYPWKYTHTWLDKPIRWVVFTVVFLTVLVRERPTILHAHSVSGPSFIAGFFARVFGIPSIIKFAGDWVWETLSTSGVKGKDFKELYASTWTGRTLRKVERIGVSLFSIIWTPSEFRRENVIELLGTDEKVRIIPNSLILPHVEWKERLPEAPVVVISANRFIPHKRIPMIVRAFARMDVPHSTLVLIGDGQESEQALVKAEIKKLGLEDRVQLTGRLSSKAIYELFSTASLYVSASLEEGFPNVFIEAMHYGLPIIATDVGGCHELVTHEVTGYLVSVYDEDDMVRRMHELGSTVELQNRFGAAAYEASKAYDLSIVVDRFIALYRSLI